MKILLVARLIPAVHKSTKHIRYNTTNKHYQSQEGTYSDFIHISLSDRPAIGYHETGGLSSEKYDFPQKAFQAAIS